jgi:hypothetical protein
MAAPVLYSGTSSSAYKLDGILSLPSESPMSIKDSLASGAFPLYREVSVDAFPAALEAIRVPWPLLVSVLSTYVI